jgi:hypothetical protein
VVRHTDHYKGKANPGDTLNREMVAFFVKHLGGGK